jgi:hypothetical protein
MINDEPLDLDEDLFDFDELLRDAELYAKSGAPPSELAPEPAPPPPALPAPAAEATHRPPRRPPPVAPRPAPVPVAAPARVEVAELADTQTHVPQQFRLGRGLALTLCGAAAINLAVLALVFQALGTVRGMVSEVGKTAPSAESGAQPHGSALGLGRVGESESAPPAEGESALARAAELLANGEHQRAREALYALLAVSDRLPADSRAGVEARARILVADAWRLEADALERESVALAAEEEPAR